MNRSERRGHGKCPVRLSPSPIAALSLPSIFHPSPAERVSHLGSKRLPAQKVCLRFFATSCREGQIGVGAALIVPHLAVRTFAGLLKSVLAIGLDAGGGALN